MHASQNQSLPPGATLKKRWRSFEGVQSVYVHESRETGTPMEFAVYEPSVPVGRDCPVLYFLSGLTCTWENCVTKGGVQLWAARHGVIVVWPDTSPRGEAAPDAPGQEDLGQGAGFYLDATESPWGENYRMESYVREELPALIEPALRQFSRRRGIFGHSMGGHGALTLALRHPEFYESVSAFSPIVRPSEVPWGSRAFSAYLGENRSVWLEHDACELILERGCDKPLLVDVGDADPFLASQLKPELLEQVCKQKGVQLTLRRQPGYDHSYYFISTFMESHIAWHAERLRM